MLTGFSKILAVVMAAVSVATLGVVLVLAAGGPNWQAEASAMKAYEFTKNEGETPTWTAKTRSARAPQGGGAPSTVTVASNVSTLPDAMIKAHEQTIKDLTEEKTQLDRDIPIYQSRIKEASDLIQQDLVAMKKREDTLIAERDAMASAIDAIRKDNITRSQEIKAVGEERDKRRDDVFRLQNELDALRADRFRMIEQQRQLTDLLMRMKGSNANLSRREAQLEAMGAVDPEYDEKTKPAKEPSEPKPEDAKPDDAKPEDTKSEE